MRQLRRAEFRVAATAYFGMPGALAASPVGDTTIVSSSNGSLAGAANDLLDALFLRVWGNPLQLRLICWTR